MKLLNFRKRKFDVYEDDSATQVVGEREREAYKHHTQREVDVLRSLTAYKNEQRDNALYGQKSAHTQYNVDEHCGFERTTSWRNRTKLRPGELIQQGVIDRDPRADNKRRWTHQMTQQLANYIDQAEEEQLAKGWQEIAIDAGIDLGQPAIAACTIQRHMNECDYYNRKALRRTLKGPVIETMRRNAIQSWKLLATKNVEMLRFSDESHKGVPHECTHNIKRRIGQRNNVEKIQYDVPPEKRPGKKGKKPPEEGLPDGDEDLRSQYKEECVHFWAAVGINFKSRLLFYDCGNSNGAMTNSVYCNILRDEVARWQAQEPERPFILVEDRASGHGAHKTEVFGIQEGADWPKSRKGRNIVIQVKSDLGIKWVFLPPASPDLNIIETVWKALKQKFEARGTAAMTKEDKQAILTEIWEEEISKEWINELILGGAGVGQKSLFQRVLDIEMTEGRPTAN
jgi:hypothetical protein